MNASGVATSGSSRHLERAVVTAPRLPQPHARRKQELLPRVRADRIAEARVIVAALETIRAGLLDVGPADRQLGRDSSSS